MEYYFSSFEYGPFCIKCTLYIFELLRRRSLLLIKWHTVYWYIIYIELYLLMSLNVFNELNCPETCYCISILSDFVNAYFFKYNFHKNILISLFPGVVMLK